jgi:hypothetical protein
MTAAKDVADAALRCLVRRDWSGIRRISVLGPGDLSFNQAAAILEQVLDAPVRYTPVAADDYVRNLVRSGASLHHALSAAATFAALARGIRRAETPAADSTRSTTLADWTSSELLPMLKATRWRPEAGAAPVRVGELQFAAGAGEEAARRLMDSNGMMISDVGS